MRIDCRSFRFHLKNIPLTQTKLRKEVKHDRPYIQG